MTLYMKIGLVGRHRLNQPLYYHVYTDLMRLSTPQKLKADHMLPKHEVNLTINYMSVNFKVSLLIK